MRRLRPVVVAIAVLVGVLTPAGAYASSTAVAASPVNSVFAFCNATGGTIACFNANLHFINSQAFTLTNIQLKDTLCDHRSVYARIFSQSTEWERGNVGGNHWTFANEKGCGTTLTVPSFTFSDSPNPVDWVQVDLFACSFGSCSTHVNSFRHGNPYTGN